MHAAPQSLIDEITKIEAQLDDVVNHGSDDDLFIASYLQGHFMVVARPLEVETDASVEDLDEGMRKSFTTAFRNRELEEADQDKVLALWQRLRG
ncbi:YfcL family protein [Alteromonas halophila]|uniref:YfcL family protein n=1 Tax=Alteromonas halophila TaxID=516698 RepID=A0A918JR55_9ALTE|nr:YfcL family protein [Alteromonas halophila]GGW95071.1 hypothetical protein GCM10007391_31640 [Alteromonas halophila]